MSRILLLVLTAAVLGCGTLDAQSRPCPTITRDIADQRFAPGQVWSYTARPGESASTLTILRIDRSEKVGVILHVRVDGLLAHNPRGELVPSVLHMPFNRDALLGSTEKLLRTADTMPTLEGLHIWELDCGGVYTISVRDAVEVMERTFNQR